MPKRKDGKYIQVCPKCKSPDVGSDAANQLQSIGAPAMLVCNACGHAGPVFPEVAVAEIEEIRKMPAESQASKERPPLVDISYGKFIAKGQWKIEAPLVIARSCLFIDDFSILLNHVS